MSTTSTTHRAAADPADAADAADTAKPLGFKRHLVPHVIPGEALYLASEHGVSLVRGKLAGALAPLLDGTRSEPEIHAELDGLASAERVQAAMDRLRQGGWVGYADPAVDRGTAAFYETAGLDGDTAVAQLRSQTVRIRTYGGTDPAALVAALAGLGVTDVRIDSAGTGETGADDTAARTPRSADDETGARTPEPPAALTIALTDDYLQPALADHNAAALASGTPWLIARPVGTVLWLGPVFVPGETGCWQCLAQRLAANRQSLGYLQNRLESAAPVVTAGARLPLTMAIGAQMAALEAAKWLAGLRPDKTAVLTLDLLGTTTEQHVLVRRPQCPACGDPGLQAEQGMRPVVFAPRPKSFTADGGHRAASPEQMLDRYAHQISPITGVATKLVPDVGAADGLRVYVAGQNLSRRITDLNMLKNGLRALSCGKGKTDAQARASALGEAIERYSGVYRGDEARRRASYTELGPSAVHPYAAMMFSDRQYRERDRWNARGHMFSMVPEPFDDEAVIDWSPVWSLSRQTVRWMPTGWLYYSAPHAETHSVAADSNGAAAGTSLEDAALQGFFELVERDSVGLWWYNMVRRPGIDLDAFDDPYVHRLREIYAGMHREVWALDLTSDFGIPAIGAFSRRTDKPAEDILVAFGAHLDPKIALMRALTEMNQFVSSAQTVEGAAPGTYRGVYPEHADWWRTATVENQPYLLPDPAAPLSTPASWPALAGDDLAADLALVQGMVEQRGMEMLILDQTRPDIGLPVVKVIVPGMRHFWTRFAPGRLYDVPVQLGWLSEPTPEERLNPVAMFV